VRHFAVEQLRARSGESLQEDPGIIDLEAVVPGVDGGEKSFGGQSSVGFFCRMWRLAGLRELMHLNLKHKS
jgi:hypothetical protein